MAYTWSRVTDTHRVSVAFITLSIQTHFQYPFSALSYLMTVVWDRSNYPDLMSTIFSYLYLQDNPYVFENNADSDEAPVIIRAGVAFPPRE